MLIFYDYYETILMMINKDLIIRTLEYGGEEYVGGLMWKGRYVIKILLMNSLLNQKYVLQ